MRKGFTLIEVMVAAAILAVGTLGVLGMQLSVFDYNRLVAQRMAAVTLAEQQLAILELQSLNDCETGTVCYALKNQAISAGSWRGINMTTGNPKENASLTSKNGIFQNSGNQVIDTPFYVAYYNLGFMSTNTAKYNELCPNQGCIRGAIRVMWARRTQRAENCQGVMSILDEVQTRGGNLDCEFVTLPFVFSTTNIYKT